MASERVTYPYPCLSPGRVDCPVCDARQYERCIVEAQAEDWYLNGPVPTHNARREAGKRLDAKLAEYYGHLLQDEPSDWDDRANLGGPWADRAAWVNHLYTPAFGDE